MTQRYRTGLFGSIGEANVKASEFFAEERQRQESQANARAQIELQRQAETRAQERDKFDRVNDLFKNEDSLFGWLDENDKYLTDEDRQFANAYRGRAQAARQQYLLTGDSSLLDQMARDFPNGMLGQSTAGGVVDFNTIRQGATARKPEVDFNRNLTDKVGEQFTGMYTAALALVTDPNQRKVLTDIAAQVRDGTIDRSEGVSRLTAAVSQNSYTGFVANNIGKIGVDPNVTAMAYNLIGRPRPSNAEQAAAYDQIAELFGIDPETGKPLVNQTDAQKRNQLMATTQLDSIVQTARRAGLENDSIAARLKLDSVTADRIERMTSVEIDKLEADIALAQQEYEKNGLVIPLEIERMQDEAASRRLVLQQQQATQSQRIATELAQLRTAENVSESTSRMVRTLEAQQVSGVVADLITKGEAGVVGLTILRQANRLTEAQFNDAIAAARETEAVRQASSAASLATANLTREQAVQGLEQSRFKTAQERGAAIAVIAARGNAGKIELKSLLDRKLISQAEYDAGLLAARAAQSNVDRTNLGADRESANNQDTVWLRGASAFNGQAARAQHISNIRRSNQQAFNAAAQALGFTPAQYEADLLARANQAALAREGDRAQQAAQTRLTQAQQAAVLDGTDLARDKFDEDKRQFDATNKRLQEQHNAALAQSRATTRAANLSNTSINKALENLRGSLTNMERARNTISDRQSSIDTRIAQLTQAIAKDPEKPLGYTGNWAAYLEERRKTLQAELDVLKSQRQSAVQQLGELDEEILANRTLQQNMVQQQAAGATTYTPKPSAPPPPPPANSSFTRQVNGVTQTFNQPPQQGADWATYNAGTKLESDLNGLINVPKIGLTALTSTYRSAPTPEVAANIRVQLDNLFLRTGSLNNAENRAGFLDWLTRKYTITIPQQLGDEWVRG